MDKTCYFPSGTLDYHSTPCNLQATHSACCPPSSLCLTNGLCLGATSSRPNMLSRVSCTDSAFVDPSCPEPCADVYTSGAISVILSHFDSPAVTGAYYCCNGFQGYNSSLCLLPSQGNPYAFAVANGNVIGNRTDGTLGLEGMGVAAAATTTTTSAVGASAAANGDPHRAVAVGVGVGVPLAVLLVAAGVAIFVLARRREQRRRERGTELPADGASYPYPKRGELAGVQVSGFRWPG